MSLNNAKVEMTLGELQELQGAKAKAEQETAEVRKQLEIAKSISGDERVAKVTAFARHCLTVARFAIANCPPEVIKGWPYESVRGLCATIDSLPDFSTVDRDMAIDLLSFAADCEEHELRRRGVVAPKRITVPPVDKAAHDI
jgi:hypothetical protein